MVLDIDDGYTLEGKTLGDDGAGRKLPVVAFKYRPPLAAEMTAHRFATGAATTDETLFAARVKFLLARLVSWDVTLKGGPAPITAETLRKIPDPIFIDLVNGCTEWKPKPEEEARGN